MDNVDIAIIHRYRAETEFSHHYKDMMVVKKSFSKNPLIPSWLQTQCWCWLPWYLHQQPASCTSGLVMSAYTPGTASPHSRPQLTTPTWISLATWVFYHQPLIIILSCPCPVPDGVATQGTHQRPAPVPGARVLASLAPGAEEGLVQPEPGHKS